MNDQVKSLMMIPASSFQEVMSIVNKLSYDDLEQAGSTQPILLKMAAVRLGGWSCTHEASLKCPPLASAAESILPLRIPLLC